MSEGDGGASDVSEEDLAAVVERERAQDAVDALDAEGVYDASRSIRAHGEGVAIPVTAEPAETAVLRVEPVDLPARNRDLTDLLAARGWSEAELARAPSSWAVIGDVVLLDSEGLRPSGNRTRSDDDGDFPRPAEVGEALLDLHGAADTALLHRGVAGPERTPDTEVLAGSGDTEVVHTEHGTRYALDLAEVMFSPGNKAERARMGEVAAEGERVFDMFAGVGYFALPMARAGARVTAAEINPAAYRYLLENAVLNGVQDRVDAYRADCRDVDATAERVVMGYFGVSADEAEGSETAKRSREAHEYLDAALAALEPGGVLHLHEATPEAELWDRPVGRIEAAADEVGRAVEVQDRRVVKSHSPGVKHVVVDARVD